MLLLTILNQIKDNSVRSIIVLEEPEQNLEPALARWIFSEMCKRANNDQNQLFITTHSPTLIGELGGSDPLLLFPPRPGKNKTVQILNARYLPTEVRKAFERNREKYAPALLARHVLIVEGASELGLLPVAFRHLANGRPETNPFHLGLEIIEVGNRDKTLEHAKSLAKFGRLCHILIDHDPPEKGKPSTSDLLKEAEQNGIVASCWAKEELLPFVKSCNLEVVLVHGVAPPILFEAIKIAYQDPGHDLKQDCWLEARRKVNEKVRSILPEEFSKLEDFNLDSLPDETAQKAFLFALLHGPHECKSVKDMRLIAEYLAIKNAFPAALHNLGKRIVAAIIAPEKVKYDDNYLTQC